MFVDSKIYIDNGWSMYWLTIKSQTVLSKYMSKCHIFIFSVLIQSPYGIPINRNI